VLPPGGRSVIAHTAGPAAAVTLTQTAWRAVSCCQREGGGAAVREPGGGGQRRDSGRTAPSSSPVGADRARPIQLDVKAS